MAKNYGHCAGQQARVTKMKRDKTYWGRVVYVVVGVLYADGLDSTCVMRRAFCMKEILLERCATVHNFLMFISRPDIYCAYY